jgi:hypothetical protein
MIRPGFLDAEARKDLIALALAPSSGTNMASANPQLMTNLPALPRIRSRGTL